MEIERVYTYEIYPECWQEAKMLSTIQSCKEIWNKCLDHYNETGEIYTKEEIKKMIPIWRRDKIPLLCSRVDFEKTAKKEGNIRQKRVDDKKGSFVLFNSHIPENNRISLYPYGTLKISRGKILPPDCKIISYTIKKTAFNWRLFIDVKMNVKGGDSGEQLQTRAIGLDYSATNFYIADDGTSPELPKLYRGNEEKLKKVQKQMAKAKTEEEREKYHRRFTKIQTKIRNRRNDFLHKLSNELTEKYDYIFIETLSMETMKQDGKGKSSGDNSWYMFTRMLEYKAKMKGKTVIKIDKWFPSSKTCSVCGHINHNLKLNEREWTCPHCQTKHDRDLNAAKNIKAKGLEELKNRSRE